MGGCPLQQNVDSVPNQNPRTPQNQESDEHTDQRIRDLIAADDDSDAGDHSAKRTDGVGNDVKERTAYVEAVLMLSEQKVRTGEVCEQSDDGNDQHPVGFNSWRIPEAVICLVKDVKRHQNQNDAVHQRGKNFNTVEAVSLSWCCAS